MDLRGFFLVLLHLHFQAGGKYIFPIGYFRQFPWEITQIKWIVARLFSAPVERSAAIPVHFMVINGYDF